MRKILVAEDEDAIREFIVINLKRSGYEVHDVNNGSDAILAYNQSKGDFDIALLDIMMPGTDGITVCRELRKNNPNLGIIMLTAKSQEMDKISGLMNGADDYITKPFSPSELMARIDALYRRVALKGGNEQSYCEELRSGDFVLNLRNRTLTAKGEIVELTQVEFQIMEFFFTNEGKALSRLDILNHVWGTEYFGEEKIVDVNIRRLRMKIEEQPSSPRHILTIWGFGYKWES